jgi:Ca2+/Na+ antiporter
MESSAEKATLILLGVAAAGWYVSSRAALQALTAAGNSPGRRALGYWLPTAMVVIGALIIGRAEIAVGIIFATSVAALTLVLGIITLTARHTHTTESRRLWAFVLPVALIALLIGFSGGISWRHVPILLLEGAVLAALWNEPAVARLASEGATDPAAPDSTATSPDRRSDNSLLLLFAVLAGGMSTWAGLVAGVDLANQLELPGAGLVAALMLAPALVLSMIGTGSMLASDGRYDQAVSSQVAYVLLNLCLLLPVATTLWLTRPHWHAPFQARLTPSTNPGTAPATTGALESPDAGPTPALIYPMGVWRIDTVILIALGLLLLPVALGKWSLGMSEGFGLIVGYTAYMVLTAWLAR